MKGVIFVDYDKTLCHDKFWRSLPAQECDRIQDFIFGIRRDLAAPWLIGKLSSEEIHQEIAKATGLSYDHLWETFVRECETMHVDPAVLHKIQALRARFKMVLATDNMDCFRRFTVPALKLEDYFDQLLISSDLGFPKEEEQGEFYKRGLDAGQSLEESVLIDNSAGGCAYFRALGGEALHVTKEKPLAYWLHHWASLRV